MSRFDYRLDIVENLLFGHYYPMAKENSYDSFLLKERVVAFKNQEVDRGAYAFRFAEPVNPKMKFYYQLLINDSVDYCNDILTFSAGLVDLDIRAYFREELLNGHLKRLLIEVGKVIRENGFKQSDFMNPSDGLSMEHKSNSYVFHLLKMVLVRIYLEMQDLFGAVNGDRLSASYLLAGLVGDNEANDWKIIKRVKKREALSEYKKELSTSKESASVDELVGDMKSDMKSEVKLEKITSDKYLKVIDIADRIGKNEKSVRRLLQNGKMKGFKQGNNWLVAEEDFEAYMSSLKKR